MSDMSTDDGSEVTAEALRPHGPHLPTVLSGVAVLVLAAIAFVWRLVDAPDWAVVGIGIGVAAGALLLVVAAVSLVTQHAHGRTP